MKKVLLSVVVLCIGFAAGAQPSSVQQTVDALAGNKALKGAVWGVLVKDADGKVVARHNEGQRMVPASNLKLVTVGSALYALGPDYRIPTTLGYTGSITGDGTLEGDLYIIGGGDPTLGSKDAMAYRPESLFWKWKTLLREAGIERIHGRIIGDGTAFEGHLEHPSWEYDDIGTYYGTGTNALCFYENAIDFSVQATRPGEAVDVRQTYPDTPWLHWDNHSSTGPAGTGNSLYLFTTDLAPYAELRGTFASDRRPKTEHFSNKYGDLTCAYYFWKNLQETGWEVTGGYARVDCQGRIQGPDFLPLEKAGVPMPIGSSESPRLQEIARETLVRSDNFYAESLLRLMGEKYCGQAVYDSCLVAVNELLQDLGVPAEGCRQVDGSGLSRMNNLSPEWMVSFLEAMSATPASDALIAAMPRPGEGTLQTLLPNQEGRERLALKSGSMGGTLCYAGYVLGADGRPAYTLSMMVNNASASDGDVRMALSLILARLLVQ